MLALPAGAPAAISTGTIAGGNQNWISPGCDARVFVCLVGTNTWIDLGFLQKFELLFPLDTLDYNIGQPAGTVKSARTKQGAGFTVAASEMSPQNLAIVLGQTLGTVAGANYTIAAQKYTFSSSQLDSQGCEYIDLPDAAAPVPALVVDNAATGGTAYNTGGNGHDLLFTDGVPGVSKARLTKVPGSTIADGGSIWVTVTLTPVASQFVNVAKNTAVQEYLVVAFFRNGDTGQVYNFQHTRCQVGQSQYAWTQQVGGGYVEPSITFKALLDQTMTDPDGAVAQYGVVSVPVLPTN